MLLFSDWIIIKQERISIDQAVGVSRSEDVSSHFEVKYSDYEKLDTMNMKVSRPLI